MRLLVRPRIRALGLAAEGKRELAASQLAGIADPDPLHFVEVGPGRSCWGASSPPSM